MIVIKPNFYYLLELFDDIKHRRPFRADNVKMTAPRKTGKSREVEQFVMLACLLNPHNENKPLVKALVIRDEVNGARETFYEYLGVADGIAGDDLKRETITSLEIKFNNGNSIRAKGLNTVKKSSAASSDKLVGFGNMNCVYLIIHIEEAYQVSNDDVQAITEAVRGFDHMIIIQSSNPGNIKNDYIQSCAEILPYDSSILMDDKASEQFIFKDKTIVHYSRGENNPFLTEQEKKNLLDLRTRDPRRARIASYGLPGIEEGAIYQHYLSSIKIYNKKDHGYVDRPYKYICGIDWGITKSSTAVVFGAIGHRNQGLAVLDSGEHNNDSMSQLTSAEMAKRIVLGLKPMKQKYSTLTMLIVKVDYSAFGIIDLLNLYAKQENMYGIDFIPCLKHPISTRIDVLTAMMSLGMVIFDKPKIQPLGNDLELSTWDLTRRVDGRYARVDKYDHHLNALEYAMDDETYNFIDDKSLYLSK